MTSYASPLELSTYLTGNTDLGALSAEWVAQATLLLEMISEDIDAAGGVPLEAGSATLALAGTWSRDLELPVGPIRAINAVTVDGIAQGAATYWWNDRHLIRRGWSPLADEVDDDDYAVGRRPMGAQHRTGVSWHSPASTVLIDLDYGFDDVPGFVQSLALRVAARTIGNPTNVTQESLAVYSVTYGQSRSDQGSHLTERERVRLRQLLRARGGTIQPLAL